MIQLYIQCKRKLYEEQILDLMSLSMVRFRRSGDRVVFTERKCTKHVAASKLYKNKLVILSGASFYVSIEIFKVKEPTKSHIYIF